MILYIIRNLFQDYFWNSGCSLTGTVSSMDVSNKCTVYVGNNIQEKRITGLTSRNSFLSHAACWADNWFLSSICFSNSFLKLIFFWASNSFSIFSLSASNNNWSFSTNVSINFSRSVSRSWKIFFPANY